MAADLVAAGSAVAVGGGHAGMAGPSTAIPAWVGDVMVVAAAMLRYGLPACPSGLRFEARYDVGGMWLRLTRPAGAVPTGVGWMPGDLMLIDSRAARWGACGDGAESTLWALVRLDGDHAGRCRCGSAAGNRGDHDGLQ